MRRHSSPTFLFADLAGYTELTERQGDEAAARLAGAFRGAMRALSRAHRAWQVKSMGDGVMIWAPQPAQAVELATRVVREVGTRPDLLPVRVGVHTGPAVMVGFDWYGSTVNVAARLASAARPNEALISSATYVAADHAPKGPIAIRRELVLHGVEQPVVAWLST